MEQGWHRDKIGRATLYVGQVQVRSVCEGPDEEGTRRDEEGTRRGRGRDVGQVAEGGPSRAGTRAGGPASRPPSRRAAAARYPTAMRRRVGVSKRYREREKARKRGKEMESERAGEGEREEGTR